MRKLLKWVGIVLGGLVGLVVLALGSVLAYGEIYYNTLRSDRPLYLIQADMSPEGLERGKYLVENVMACNGACHSPQDGTPLTGTSENLSIGPIKVVFTAPNLTPDMETGLGSWSDAEMARAIREGLDKDGKVLGIMPAFNYHDMSDRDISAVVGYLRSLEPVNNPLPPFSANAFGKVALVFELFLPKSLGAPITASQETPAAGTTEYGEYLAKIGGCRDCHGMDFSGGLPPGGEPGALPAANLTPAGKMATWTEADFITVMKTGMRPDATRVSPEMPWLEYGKMREEDLAAMFKFFSALSPVESDPS